MNPLARDLDHILSHTAEVWELLRGKSIFVTGGTGFIGRWLLESFALANQRFDLRARMVVLSRNPAGFATTAPHLSRGAGISFVTGDVCRLDAAEIRVQLGRDQPSGYTFVIHAATEANAELNAERPLQMINTIVQGTHDALEFAREAGAHRVLLTSSGAVYGPQPTDVTHVGEQYAGAPICVDPDSAYAEAKRIAELMCVCFQKQHQIETVIARCFAFVGPFLPLDRHFAIGNFIGNACRDEPVVVRGDGTPFRSYLYAADLAIWLWILLVKGRASYPYNVGSEDGRPIRHIAEEVANVVGGVEVRVAQKPDSTKPPPRYVPSTKRAREELGLKEWVSLSSAIQRTWEYHVAAKQTSARADYVEADSKNSSNVYDGGR